MDQKENERLKQKLQLLGEPELPARLSPEELFRRMDSGELTLPEDEMTPAEPKSKVIPWARVMKRGLPVAACLALVLLLYRGQQTIFSPKGGMAPDVLSSSAAQAAPEMAQAAGAEENAPAAYSYNTEAVSEDAGEPETPDPAMDAAAPRMAAGPAPEEEQASDADAATGETADAADEERARQDGGEDEQKQVTNSGATTDDRADSMEDVNPDIGWVPEVGGMLEDELPPIFTFQELEPYMLAAAAEHAPADGLTPVITWKSWNNQQKDKFVYTVKYLDEKGQDAGLLTLYCHLDPEADTPEVVVDSSWEGSIY